MKRATWLLVLFQAYRIAVWSCLLFLALVPVSESAAESVLWPEGKPEILPLPAFPTSKNEGSSKGLVLAMLYKNHNGEMNTLLAPLFLNNDAIFGQKMAVNYFRFFPEQRNYKLTLSYSTKYEWRTRFLYQDLQFGGGRFMLNAGTEFEKDATPRFFGLSASSRSEDETNYSQKKSVAFVSLGAKLASLGLEPNQALVLTLREQYREDEVKNGALNGSGDNLFPFTRDRFPQVPGINGATLLSHRLTVSYDTRDSLFTPAQGTYLELFGELAHNFRTASAPYTRYGIEARHLRPFSGDRFTLVVRGALQSVNGPGIPFFDRSSLGGETSLRGFGRGRFIDDGLVNVSVEERIRVFQMRFLGTDTQWQVAPFLDTGRVFSSYKHLFQRKQFELNPGVGFRLLARPNFVGRVDVAFGREGAVVFAGLDYPF